MGDFGIAEGESVAAPFSRIVGNGFDRQPFFSLSLLSLVCGTSVATVGRKVGVDGVIVCVFGLSPCRWAGTFSEERGCGKAGWYPQSDTTPPYGYRDLFSLLCRAR